MQDIYHRWRSGEQWLPDQLRSAWFSVSDRSGLNCFGARTTRCGQEAKHNANIAAAAATAQPYSPRALAQVRLVHSDKVRTSFRHLDTQTTFITKLTALTEATPTSLRCLYGAYIFAFLLLYDDKKTSNSLRAYCTLDKPCGRIQSFECTGIGRHN